MLHQTKQISCLRILFFAVVVGLICGSTLYVVEGLHLEMMKPPVDNESQLFGSTDCDELTMGKYAEQDCGEAETETTLPALTDKDWDGKLDALARGEAEGLWFKSGKLWFKVKEGGVKAEL